MLKLVPPRAGKSPNWRIRGTYLKVYVDKSCGTDKRFVARARLAHLQERSSAANTRRMGPKPNPTRRRSSPQPSPTSRPDAGHGTSPASSDTSEKNR